MIGTILLAYLNKKSKYVPLLAIICMNNLKSYLVQVYKINKDSINEQKIEQMRGGARPSHPTGSSSVRKQIVFST